MTAKELLKIYEEAYKAWDLAIENSPHTIHVTYDRMQAARKAWIHQDALELTEQQLALHNCK